MIDEKMLIEKIKSIRLYFRGPRSGEKMVDEYLKHYRQAILDTIEKQPKVCEWIPVEERLPNNDEEVLVWFEYFRYGSYDCLFQTVGIGLMINDHWSCIVNGTTGWKDLKILAWMPLPEQYRKEGSNE